MANASDVKDVALEFVNDLGCMPMVLAAFRLRLRDYIEKEQDDEALDSWLSDSAGYPGLSFDDLEAAFAHQRKHSVGYWAGQYTLTAEGRVFGALEIYRTEVRINGQLVKAYSYENDRLTWEVQDGVTVSGALELRMTGDADLHGFDSGSTGKELTGVFGVAGESPARSVVAYGTTHVRSFGERAALHAEAGASPDLWNGDYLSGGSEAADATRLVVDLVGGKGKITYNGVQLAASDYSSSTSGVVNGRPEPNMLVWDDTAGPSKTKGKVTFSRADKNTSRCSGTVTKDGKPTAIDLTAATLSAWNGTYALKPFPSGASTFPELVLKLEADDTGKITYGGIALSVADYSAFGASAANGMRSRNVLVWDDSAGETGTRGELRFSSDDEENKVFVGYIRSGNDGSKDINVCGAMVKDEHESPVKSGVDWTILLGTWLAAAVAAIGVIVAVVELRNASAEARTHRADKKKAKEDPSPKNKKQAHDSGQQTTKILDDSDVELTNMGNENSVPVTKEAFADEKKRFDDVGEALDGVVTARAKETLRIEKAYNESKKAFDAFNAEIEKQTEIRDSKEKEQKDRDAAKKWLEDKKEEWQEARDELDETGHERDTAKDLEAEARRHVADHKRRQHIDVTAI